MTSVYRVELRGSGFRLSLEGRNGVYGFVTERLVRAASPDAATKEAVRSVLDRPTVRAQVGAEGTTAAVQVGAVVECPAGVQPPDVQPGLSWFEESGH